MKYKLIDGFPTSEYGTVVAKRCRWCYNIIQSNGVGKREGIVNKEKFFYAIWCSPDCKQEESDWKYLRNYRKTIEALRRKTKEKNKGKIVKIGRPKISNLSTKEKKRIYYLKNRERLLKMAKVYRRRNKVGKLQTNIDKQIQ